MKACKNKDYLEIRCNSVEACFMFYRTLAETGTYAVKETDSKAVLVLTDHNECVNHKTRFPLKLVKKSDNAVCVKFSRNKEK